MCGISAFMSHSSSHRGPEETKKIVNELESSLDIIAHRGPDARGTWYSKNHQVGQYYPFPREESNRQPFS